MASLYSAIFEKYLPSNLRIRSPRTRVLYGFAYQSFARFLGREPDWADLNDDAFAAWMTHQLVEQELAETTINGYFEKLRAFWEWAARKKFVDQFPTIGCLPEPERLPVAWREDELVKLFNGCRMQRGYVGDVPMWRFMFTLHAWWWNTSERIGATMLLRVDHLRLDEAIAVVPASIRKGQKRGRVYRLWPDTVLMLRAILPPYSQPRELVFDWDQYRCRETFYNHYDKMLVSVGLPHDRYRKPHCMRVSHASWTKFFGGDAAQALGHKDGSTIWRYLDPTLEKPDERRLFLPWDRSPPPGD